MSVPYPDPVVITLLSELPAVQAVVGDRVGTKLDKRLPAIRVTKVRENEGTSEWEATPVYQVEIWADDKGPNGTKVIGEFVAGQLAWDLKAAWPSAVKRVVGDARVTHRWVDMNPIHSPDPETETSRYLVHLGIRLSGASA